MESLCYSANKVSDDAYDVSTSLTGYEPNFMAFSELNDSSGSFSYIIPSSDQDMDDVTLGKLLTEAHRGQADYCEPGGMSVSQSSSSVMFDRTGKLDGEKCRTNQLVLVSQGTRTVLTASFLKTPKLRKWSMDQGNLQIRTLLEEQRQMIIAEISRKSRSSRTPCSSCRRRAAPTIGTS